MTKFPTPSQATTVNSLNVVSPAELQTSLQVKTAIALDDGTPRSFDIKALDSLAHDNQSQLAQVGQQLIQHQQSIIELQAKLAGSQTSPLQDRILAIEQELKRLTNEGMALANQIYIALTSQPNLYRSN